MIKLQVNYTTTGGEKKTRTITYANPASTNATLKDFANALYALSTNTINDIYKIDTAILLDDDSDDIVTPIVETPTETQVFSPVIIPVSNEDTPAFCANAKQYISTSAFDYGDIYSAFDDPEIIPEGFPLTSLAVHTCRLSTAQLNHYKTQSPPITVEPATFRPEDCNEAYFDDNEENGAGVILVVEADSGLTAFSNVSDGTYTELIDCEGGGESLSVFVLPILGYSEEGILHFIFPSAFVDALISLNNPYFTAVVNSR